MEQYTALIVEDVKETSDYIFARIQKFCPQINLLHQAYDLESAYEKILANNYHIVFLDIQMPDGTGFDLLKMLHAENKINFELIFITGESDKDYLLRAIKYSAIDYLYKPLDDAELVIAVNKAIEKMGSLLYTQQVKILLDHISSPQYTKPSKIALYLSKGIVELFEISDIIYMQADGVVTHVFLKDKRQITTTRNIGYYKDILVTDYDFKSLSKSILVNSKYIKRYSHRDLTVTLIDGSHLYASKRFGQDLKSQFDNSWQNTKIGKLLGFGKERK